MKKNSNGSIAKYKARLIAKGYSQCLGVDYGDTYSPILKPATIRIVLTLTVTNKWDLCQSISITPSYIVFYR